MPAKEAQKDSRHWEAYWRADAGQNAAVSGDAPGDLFDATWVKFFEAAFAGRSRARLVDIACGAGVVLDRAVELLKSSACKGASFCGVDYAFSAAAKVNAKPAPRNASLTGVAASAAQLPFQHGSFDIVVSQFGLEYAGAAAFGEAARVLAPGGVAQFIIHYRGGGIERECSANARVLDDVLSTGFFGAGLDAVRGPDHDSATAELQKIMTKLSTHLDGEPLAAKQMLSRLLPDMATLVARRKAYRPADATGWVEAMHQEVQRYAGRMNAMTESALDADGVRRAAQLIDDAGAVATEPAPLVPHGKTAPAAWLLEAARPGR